MSEHEQFRTMVEFQKAHIQNTIAVIDLWCRIEAMETALTFLDARAKAVIADALEIALAKKKTERDELQNTVQILSSLLSGPPMQTEN